MREQIEGRPALLVLIGLIIGLVSFGYPVALLFLPAFLVFVRNLGPRLSVAVGFAIGLFLAPPVAVPVLEATPIHGVGVITSVPKLSQTASTCNVQVNGRNLLLSTSELGEATLGDEVEVDGVVRPISVDRQAVATIYGIEGLVSLDRVRIVRRGPWLDRLASDWRDSFHAYIDKSVPGTDGFLIDAICFGEGSLVSPDSKREMQQNGLLHIVTASGTQVFVLGFLLGMVLRFLPVPRIAHLVLLAALLCMYCLAAGLNPAVVRASLMALLAFGAFAFHKDADAMSSLSLAAIGYLLWQPSSIYNPGSQMTFVVVACLALFYRRSALESDSPKGKLIRGTNDYAKLMATIALAVAPLTAYYFGAISVDGFVRNLMVGPVLVLAIGASFVGHAMSLVLPELGNAVAQGLVAPCAELIQFVSHWGMSNAATISIPPFSGFWLFAIYGAWCLTLRRRVVQP